MGRHGPDRQRPRRRRGWPAICLPVGRFRVAGIPVAVHAGAVVVLVAVGLPLGWPGAALWPAVALPALVMHEMAHAAVAAAAGDAPVIEVGPAGGRTRVAAGHPPGTDVAITLAGPLLGLVVGGILWARGGPDAPGWWGVALGAAVWANAGWAVVNLLPVPGLDGGAALGALRRGPARRAAEAWAALAAGDLGRARRLAGRVEHPDAAVVRDVVALLTGRRPPDQPPDPAPGPETGDDTAAASPGGGPPARARPAGVRALACTDSEEALTILYSGLDEGPPGLGVLVLAHLLGHGWGHGAVERLAASPAAPAVPADQLAHLRALAARGFPRTRPRLGPAVLVAGYVLAAVVVPV